MSVYLHHIETLVPEFAYDQSYARDIVASWVTDPKLQRVIKRIYNMSGIEKRHSVLGDFMPGAEPTLFLPGPAGRPIEPGTEERNRCFIEASRRLSVDCARRALAATPWVKASCITHVITVSCTGFYNPGPDFDIVTQLGLSDRVERYNLGFMGCYAAFPALRMARQFCIADPEAVVLVVSIELCSLHLQVREDLDSMLANTLFSDGVAAAIVSATPPDRLAFAMNSFATSLAVEGRRDMAWEIGNSGFNMILSSYVPDIIAANIRAVVEAAISDAGITYSDIGCWAVHPGGKAILDKIESELGLDPKFLKASREVLRDYGNMSSATVLFVLRRLLDDRTLPDGTSVLAMAFGPGLTIETAMMELTAAGSEARISDPGAKNLA